MPINVDNIVQSGTIISDEEFFVCIDNARDLIKSMNDRGNLHERDQLERYIDILMGELAEKAVINWLTLNGKHAVSAVDKTSGNPDMGHDIELKNKEGATIKCSVKSSLSVFKDNPQDIINQFTLASTPNEVQGVNIQVYFYLEPRSTPRINTPSIKNLLIVGWAGRKDLMGEDFAAYNGENREAPNIRLKDLRPMHSLLTFLD